MNNFTNFSLSYFDMYTYIAILLTCIGTYLLLQKKIEIITFLIYLGVSLLICFTSIYQAAVLADELNLSGRSSLIYLTTLNLIIIAFTLFIKNKKKN